MANNNDDFENPDLDSGLNNEGEVDFGEFEDEKKGNSVGSLLKTSPLAKFGLIAAGVLVVVVLVTLFGGDEVKTPGSVVSKGDKDFKEAPGTKEVSPEMKEALEEKNQERLETAIKKGQSSIPTPIAPPKTLLDVPQEQTSGEDPLLRWKQMQEERARVQREQQEAQSQANNPQKDAKIQALAQAMATQMNSILSKESAKLSSMAITTASTQPGEGTPGATGPYGTPAQPPVTQPASKIIIPQGEFSYAQMLLEANSDVPGPVLALLVSGPFSGSRIMGNFSVEEEYLVIRFNTLITKKGTSVPISAIAIDPDTSLTAVATDVDHRYFKRVILPAAASFVSGLGEAVAQTTTTVVVSDGGSQSSTEDLDTKEELGKAFAESADKVSGIIDDEASKTKILVKVKAGTPVGLLFLSPVTDRGVLQAGMGYTPQAQQQGNQAVPGGQQQAFPYPFGAGNNMSQLQQLQQGLVGQQMLQGYNNGANYASGTTTTDDGSGTQTSP